MNLETGGISASQSHGRGEKRHLSLEEYKTEVLRDLEEQFTDVEMALSAGKRGGAGYLFRVAYDRLLELEQKGMVQEELSRKLHEKAEVMNAELYEEAA